MFELEVTNKIEKMQYQISLLIQAVDYAAHPLEALILNKDWGQRDVDTAHGIFEIWSNALENNQPFNNSDFENDFRAKLGENYQGMKPIILAFWRNYQWTDVCEAYVDSFGANVSAEYHEIQRRKK